MQKIKLSISFFLSMLLIFSFTMPCFAEETTYVWSSTSTPVSATVTQNQTNTLATNSTEDNEKETEKSTTSNMLNLESASAVLIEQTTGQVLFEHNPHESLRPASVTKVMSILLIMEALDNRYHFFNRYHPL